MTHIYVFVTYDYTILRKQAEQGKRVILGEGALILLFLLYRLLSAVIPVFLIAAAILF